MRGGVVELYPFCPAPPKKERVVMERRAILVPATMAVALVVAACAVALLVVAQKAEATFPGKPGKIAYSGGAPGGSPPANDQDIYTISPNGTGKFPVTKNNMGGYEPSYSPNAKRIAYTGWDGHDWEIYTIGLRGK